MQRIVANIPSVVADIPLDVGGRKGAFYVKLYIEKSMEVILCLLEKYLQL